MWAPEKAFMVGSICTKLGAERWPSTHCSKVGKRSCVECLAAITVPDLGQALNKPVD